MSTLYPSLENMEMDKLVQAQYKAAAQSIAPHNVIDNSSSGSGVMYPSLVDFMGLDLSVEMIRANMPEYLENTSPNDRSLALPSNSNLVGFQRNFVTNGIRELTLCKGADGKVGLRVKDISNGVFVNVVVRDSPAAIAGLRFGDQILQINGTVVAGYSMDKIHNLLRKSPNNDIKVAVRDRPFERIISLHKDSKKRVGFQFNDGKITSIVKDSSAAKNGLLIDHQILEINGQNTVGMKDKEITSIIEKSANTVKLTIMPSFLYDHMMKKLSSSFIRGIMDHSAADF